MVNTASLRLRVLGTAFNVRAFANEKKSEAALVHGSIEVMLVNHPDKKIILKPTEKIIVRNNVLTPSVADKVNEKDHVTAIPLITLSNIHYKDEDPLPVEAQWIEKKLAFESETFEDIAARMERYYGVQVKFDDYYTKGYVFSGSFTTETIKEAMEYLQQTSETPFKFRLGENNRVTIYK